MSNFSFTLVLAEVVANSIQIILYPISYVQHRLWCDVRQSGTAEFEFSGPSDVIRRTYQKEGVAGFYSGVIPFVLCNLTYRFAFEWVQHLLVGNEMTETTKGYMVGGGIALIVAGVLTYPLDLIRRRVILNPLSVSSEYLPHSLFPFPFSLFLLTSC